MVIVINGAIGTGKTSTAWEVLGLFDRAVMLDGDYFAALQPFSIFDPNDLAYVYKGLAHQIKFHCDHGFDHFIINYVFETVTELQKLESALPTEAGTVHKIVLACQAQERDRRIRTRNDGDIDWQLPRSAELTRILEENNANGELGRKLDTTHLSVSEVAKQIHTWTNQ